MKQPDVLKDSGPLRAEARADSSACAESSADAPAIFDGARRLFGWSALVVLLAVLLVLPWLVLDKTPAVEPPARLHYSDIVWTQTLFQKHDPRLQTPGIVQSLSLDEDEVNRLLNYMVEVRPVIGMAADLMPAGAQVTSSLRVPDNPFGRYLNVSVDLIAPAGRIEVTRAQIGDLPLPGALANLAAHLAHRLLLRDEVYAALANSIYHIEFSEDRATLDYLWQPILLAQIERKGAELLIPDAEHARLLAYADAIRAQARLLPHGSRLALPRLLSSVFTLAKKRGGDAAAENRAALTALAAYIGGISLPKLLVGDSRSNLSAPPVLLTLHGRRDFAEHYLIAAALSANGGSQFANALGLIKEEEDARKGSGFSFTDLAADRAGARLGERATEKTAETLQAKLATAQTDFYMMPDFSDLPEFMSQTEFVRRFGSVEDPRYQAVIQTMDQRLAAHELLR